MGTAWVAWLLPALWTVVFDQTGSLPPPSTWWWGAVTGSPGRIVIGGGQFPEQLLPEEREERLLGR